MSDPARRLMSALKRVDRIVWLILLMALVIRVGLIIATPGYQPTGDSADYDRHARSIAAGNGYPESQMVEGGGPTAFRPPGYPIVLTAVYAVSGESWTAGRLAQALIGTITVALIGLIAWQLWRRRRPALVAMGLAAIAPPLLVPLVALLSDPLFVALELAAVAAVLEHRSSPHRYRWALVAGALAGLAALTRTVGLPLLPILAIGVWTLRPYISRPAIAQPLALLAAALVVIAPWTVRNALVLDAFVPISTQAGYGLAVTYNDAARLDPRFPSLPHYDSEYAPLVRRGDLTEVELERELRERATSYMREHPGYVLETAWRNTLRALHLREGFYIAHSTVRAVNSPIWLADAGVIGFYLIALAAVVGAFLAPARAIPLFVWAVPVILVILAALVSGKTRYRIAADPFLILLATLAVTAGLERLLGETRRST